MAWNLYGPGADEILVRYQPDTGGGGNYIHVHYHLDAMGNVQFLLSEANFGLEKYTYDAFGQPRITGWGNNDYRAVSAYGNRFMFTGREYIYTLHLYDYRHRFYHPGLGRFIQTDPIGFKGDPMNLYRYCGGNPINHSDPTGMFFSLNAPWRDFVWDFASHADSGNTLQGLFADYTHNAYSGNGGGGAGGEGAAKSIYMRRADAIARYGSYNNGAWAEKERFMTDYRVPADILRDPGYNWRWDEEQGAGLVTHFQLNKDIATSVTHALRSLQQAHRLGDLKEFSGAYEPRNTRGSSNVSAHAYGLALDINPSTNPRGSSPSAQPLAVRTSFMGAGFVDGGTWTQPFSRPDPMHFTVGF